MVAYYSAFAILIVNCFVSFVIAGDSCPNSTIFSLSCKCSRFPVPYPHGIRNNEQKSVAPTTFPQVRDGSNYTIVECYLGPVDSRAILEQIAAELHRKWVDKLVVSTVPLETEKTVTRLPYKWLQNVRVKQFEVKNTVLSGDFIWNGRPFDGQELNLIWLAATKCSLSGALTNDTLGSVNTKGLEELTRIKGIDFSQNYLVSVEKSAFRCENCPLQTIVLSRNALQEIRECAFCSLQHLMHIDLSHNLLESIRRDIFRNPSKSLRRINISWNRLKSLPEGFFQNMTSLRYVDVSFNFLQSMPEKPWKVVWRQLNYVDVSGNFIECDCNEFGWLLTNNTADGDKDETPKRKIKGQCAHTYPSLHIRHFNLNELNASICKDEDYYDYATIWDEETQLSEFKLDGVKRRIDRQKLR